MIATEPRSLIAISHASRMLAEAKSLDDVKQIRDLAEAARVYARAHQLGIEAENHAAEIKLRAERKGGELLVESAESGERQTGGNPQLSRDATVAPTLAELGITRDQSSRMQAIAAIPEPEFEAVLADTRAAGERITSNGMVRLASLMSSDSPEWYTPDEVIERVLTVLGSIDLDPCSNSKSQPRIPAARHYTADDDGLAQPWRGRVYMNPPYGRGIFAWIEKLAEEYRDGNVTEAIALVPARVDTAWWRQFPRDVRVCFVSGRLKFSGYKDAAPFPSVAAYLGPNGDAFTRAFADFGDLWRREAA